MGRYAWILELWNFGRRTWSLEFGRGAWNLEFGEELGFWNLEEGFGVWNLEEELGIRNLEEELGVWNLEIGIPDLSAVIVAPHFGIGRGQDLSAKTVAAHFWIGTLELGIGRTAARRGASPQGWPIKSIAIGRGRARVRLRGFVQEGPQ